MILDPQLFVYLNREVDGIFVKVGMVDFLAWQ